MIPRPFWLDRIRETWRHRTIVWLAGVRRVGKTTLARMLPEADYLNCDLPSDVSRLADPELFLDGLPTGATVVFDEVHRLPDPSRLLKIAADGYPTLRVLATGSSTLAATRKFRDALTGRKKVVRLPPVLWTESLGGFGSRDLATRLHRGGLPEHLLSKQVPEESYAEWLESFYARDIQELFGIRERTGFLDLLRLMLRQSGGQVDYSALAREVGLSRPTVKAHLEAMTVALALQPLSPFHGGSRRELVKQPKVYAFDTGFVRFARGWRELRPEDMGPLWEHLVLDVLRAAVPSRPIHYWRDKSGREIDFVLPGRGRVDTFECKIDPEAFTGHALEVFRRTYPEGNDYVVAPVIDRAWQRRVAGRVVRFIGCQDLFGLA